VQHYVCNYGPTGNYKGDPLYLIGAPCTFCPEDSECTNGVLCGEYIFCFGICADVVFVCYNNDELLATSIEGICHYWDSRRQRTTVGLACSLYRGGKYAYVILADSFLGGWKGNGMIILRWMSGK